MSQKTSHGTVPLSTMRGPLSNHIIVHLARINDRASSVYKEAVNKSSELRREHLAIIRMRKPHDRNCEMESGLQQQENHGVLKTQR